MISEVINSATTAAVAAATGGAPAGSGGGSATGVEVKDGTDTRTPEEKAKAAAGGEDFFTSIWGKIKSFFGEDGLDTGGLLAGGIGALGAWIVSGMFGGSGIMGTLGFLLLAIPAFIMAKNSSLADMFRTLLNGGERTQAENTPNQPVKAASTEQDKGAAIETAPTMDPGLAAAVADYRPGTQVTFTPNASAPAAPNLPGIPKGGFTPNLPASR